MFKHSLHTQEVIYSPQNKSTHDREKKVPRYSVGFLESHYQVTPKSDNKSPSTNKWELLNPHRPKIRQSILCTIALFLSCTSKTSMKYYVFYFIFSRCLFTIFRAKWSRSWVILHCPLTPSLGCSWANSGVSSWSPVPAFRRCPDKCHMPPGRER